MSNLLNSSLLGILILVGVFLRLSVTVLCVCVCRYVCVLCACLHAYIRILWIQLFHWSLWLMHTRHSDSRKVHWNRALSFSPVFVCGVFPSVWPLVSHGKDCLCIWSWSEVQRVHCSQEGFVSIIWLQRGFFSSPQKRRAVIKNTSSPLSLWAQPALIYERRRFSPIILSPASAPLC